MKISIYFAVLFLILGFQLYGNGENLIINPDFKQLGSLPSSYRVIKGGGRSSKNALLKQRSPGSTEYQLYSLAVKPMKPNTPYMFSVWVKAENVSSEFAEVCVLEFYKKGRYQYGKAALNSDKGTYSWRKFSTVLISGEEGSADKVIAVFYLQKSVSGKIWFSEPSLKEIKPDLSRLTKESARLSTDKLPASLRSGLKTMKEQYLEKMKHFRQGGIKDLVEAMNLTEWNNLQQLWSTAQKFEKIRPQVTASSGFEDVILGLASGAEKILPKAPGFKSLPSEIVLSAARNEKESVQLILLPTAQNLEQIKVIVSDVRKSDGTLWKQPVQAFPVGYVETKFAPPTGTDYIGFYPDPLLQHLQAVNCIPKGIAQAFWLRLAVPQNQPKGIYGGKVEVSVNGKTAFRIPLKIRVYDFMLPRKAMLPLAITFLQKEKHLEEWTKMLTDYLITPDNLYTDLEFVDPNIYTPDFNLLAKMKQDGTLNHFNLGYVKEALNDPKDSYGLKRYIDVIRPRYEKAKELGLLENAYIYGCDESSKFAQVERTAQLLKAEFPNVPFFTTSFDGEFGTSGRLSSWDWFCPLIPAYAGASKTALAKARKMGKQVWWYICCVPARPFPNVFIESRAMEIRLLMGVMSAKYKPDGFLYYETTKGIASHRAEPLGNETFTSWNPNSFGQVNGDGYLFYLGPDKHPLPSLRVENFRDGLEDYAYYEILRGKVEAAKLASKNSAWLTKAEKALEIPKSLVKSLTEYTTDPSKVMVWRQTLAELIEQAE